MSQPADRYSRIAILLHWLLVALLACQMGFGWFLEDVQRGTPERTVFVNLHKSTGMILGLLILFRLYWRLTHRPPALPATMPGWQRTASRWSHGLLYACMVAIPASGYIASNFSRYGVNFFNSLKLPPWGAESEGIYAFFNGMHGIATTVFVVLVAVHLLAALQHLWKRDGLFARMWPGTRGPAT